MIILKRLSLLLLVFSILLSLIGCSAAEDIFSGIGGAFANDAVGGFASGDGKPLKGEVEGAPEIDSDASDGGGEVPDTTVKLPSGMITAGAFNDNDNYSLWIEQFAQGEENGKFYNYTLPENSWGYNSLKRVKVTVTDGENVVAGARVVANDGDGKVLFSAVSNASGEAYLFTDADSGTVTVKGKVSYVFQEPALFPWLTALENVNVVLSDGPSTLSQAEAWLREAGLAEHLHKYPHQLSGGQKQRVALCRALAYGGEILLLDEPLKGLDADTRERVVALLRRECRDKTLLLVTHDPQEAALLCDTVLQYKDGQFI